MFQTPRILLYEFYSILLYDSSRVVLLAGLRAGIPTIVPTKPALLAQHMRLPVCSHFSWVGTVLKSPKE